MTIHPNRLTALPVIAVLIGAVETRAQAPARDTLRLGALQNVAIRQDPRRPQLELLAAQSDLRLHNIAGERLPTFAIESQAQYQSDVPGFAATFPGGPPSPPHDTYDARLSAKQRLYDPGIGARRAVEQAQLAESQARVRASLYAARQHVSDAFFAALRAQAQIDVLRSAVAALEAQLGVARTRVREGSALPSEESAIRASLLQRQQAVAESEAACRASLQVLGDLTGTAPDSATVLELPDLADDVARVRAALDRADLRARPEHEQFTRSRELLERQERARSAQDKPRVSAFGRVGYGQPGLNPLNDSFDSYWLAGVQLLWTPPSWRTSRRDREVLALQRQILSSEEKAFADRLRRSVTHDLASIDRLESALATDDGIIALRERIAEETRVRFGEGAVTSAEYVDRQTDLVGARITRAIHRVELAQARTRVLTTLGIEVR